MSTLVWVLAIALCASLVLQGLMLRIAHRRKAARLQARHLQFEQALNAKLEQAKRQIGQLQSDLSATRLQLKQLKQLGGGSARTMRDVTPEREALERELLAAESLPYPLPVNGFADTRPSPQFTQFGSLLFQ